MCFTQLFGDALVSTFTKLSESIVTQLSAAQAAFEVILLVALVNCDVGALLLIDVVAVAVCDGETVLDTVDVAVAAYVVDAVELCAVEAVEKTDEVVTLDHADELAVVVAEEAKGVDALLRIDNVAVTDCDGVAVLDKADVSVAECVVDGGHAELAWVCMDASSLASADVADRIATVSSVGLVSVVMMVWQGAFLG